MKHAALIPLLLLPFFAAAQDFSPLEKKLDEYLLALRGESVAVQSAECDFLISAVADSLTREHVARKLWDHYRNSPVMGEEGVAVYLADEWFSTGKVHFETEEELQSAKAFAIFNRSSLIGMQAPQLSLKDAAGNPVPTPEGPYVLYFYDTGCSKCKLETIRLKRFISSGSGIPVFAVYVGADSEGWGIEGAINVWDPDFDGNWITDYGVVGTPRMFLIDGAGIIQGRNLDTPALEQLIQLLAL